MRTVSQICKFPNTACSPPLDLTGIVLVHFITCRWQLGNFNNSVCFNHSLFIGLIQGLKFVRMFFSGTDNLDTVNKFGPF